MNPDRWTYRWLLIVPFLVGALISHRWKMVLPVERTARIPTSKTKYLVTQKETAKIARSLNADQQPSYEPRSAKAALPRLNELPAPVIVSYLDLDPLYGLMSLQL
jgi:hypothetical protein